MWLLALAVALTFAVFIIWRALRGLGRALDANDQLREDDWD